MKGGGVYDKKGIISIYYNTTIILYSNNFIIQIIKTSENNNS